ncbi:MAG TPA: hypothetical protein PKD84_05430 [Propionicimonas sp.]|jgi:hypothetical protein|nr:hypothetical protein [Propionicimonas sp.]
MRSNRWSRLVAVGAATALSAGIALLAPASLAQAASTVSLTGPTSTVAASKTLEFVFTINGDADQWTKTLTTVSSRVSSTYRSTPGSPYTTTTPSVGTPAALYVPVYSFTTPGRYRLTVQAWESGVATATATKDFTVVASTSYSRSLSSTSISGKVGARYRTTFTVNAPRYQVGAKTAVYYKFKGKKKYVKVATGKLNSSGYAKMLTKKGKIRKAGRYYVKVGAVTYAGGYNTKTVKTYIHSY